MLSNIHNKTGEFVVISANLTTHSSKHYLERYDDMWGNTIMKVNVSLFSYHNVPSDIHESNGENERSYNESYTDSYSHHDTHRVYRVWYCVCHVFRRYCWKINILKNITQYMKASRMCHTAIWKAGVRICLTFLFISEDAVINNIHKTDVYPQHFLYTYVIYLPVL